MRKRLLFAFLLVSVCVYSSGTNSTAYGQNENMYEINITQNVNLSKAEQLVEEGNYDGALEIYNSALEKNPESIPARVGRAKIYSELYKIKAAQREFKRVLSQDPNNSAARNGLGMTYYRMTTSSNMDIRNDTGNLYRKASEEFKAAIAADQNNDEAQANLGMIYQHQGRIKDAEMQYRQALAINPLNSNANYRFGTILYEKGNTDSAIDHYKKALEINSKNSSAHFHLGEALISQGKYSEAIEALQTSLYLQPNSAPVHEKLGEAYKHQGNETAAIEMFKKAIAIKPEDTLPYLLLSSVYEDRNDNELAIAELKSALENNPDFSEAKLKIAEMSLTTGKVDQAIEYYKKTLIDDPGNPVAENGLSKAYFRKVQNDVSSGIVASPARLLEAEKYIDSAISNNPEDLELHYAKFKIEKLANKPEPTREELRALSDSVPSTIPQALDKGYALYKLQDFQQANNIFRGVTNQVSGHEDRLMVAETLIEYKNYDVAEEMFNMMLAEDPKNVQAQRGLEKIKNQRSESEENYRLGWDLYKKGQRNSALDQFKKAQNLNPAFEKPYYWAAELLKKEDEVAEAYQNYSIFLKLTNNINLDEADKDLVKRRKHAEKMVDKLGKKLAKEKN
jgi:tetratricopeptide (TPR) repeat protein